MAMMVGVIWLAMKLIAMVLVLSLSAGHHSIEQFHGRGIARLHPIDVAFAPFPTTESPQNEESVFPVISLHRRRHMRKSFYSRPPYSSYPNIRPISGLHPTSSYTPLHPPESFPVIKRRHSSPPLSQGDCSLIECSESLTITPPEFPCLCVSPIRVTILLGIPLYTFFPLVSELSKEVAAGTLLKQSQVRVVGANSEGPQPQKTVVLINLVPSQAKFDTVAAFRIYYSFWHKRIYINTSLFGNYEVLHVRYSGLPPSPLVGSPDSKPDSPGDGDGRVIKPVGINVGDGTQNRKKPSHRVVVGIVVSTSIAIGFCSFAACVLLKLRFHPPTLKLLPPPVPSGHSGGAISTVESGFSMASISLASTISTMYTGSAQFFTSGDIRRATYNFHPSKLLGEGGFGLVYAGILNDGTHVAVKILKRVDEKSEREFLSEVEMLTRLHHRNLVKLIGLCTEQEARSLIYELIPNGSLESHLHGVDKERSPLDWDARMKIAVGAARALSYLHEDSSPSVIHRDFKSSNILLDKDFFPKVSDFGLAKTAMDEQNKHSSSSHFMGTFGYVAPEYTMTGNFIAKSDVYSYGVVLLELLSGRRPVDMSGPLGRESLVGWARPLLSTPGRLMEILDPHLVGPAFPVDSGARVATIASLCIHPEPSCRPSMSEVLQALRLVRDDHGSSELDVAPPLIPVSRGGPDFCERGQLVSGGGPDSRDPRPFVSGGGLDSREPGPLVSGGGLDSREPGPHVSGGDLDSREGGPYVSELSFSKFIGFGWLRPSLVLKHSMSAGSGGASEASVRKKSPRRWFKRSKSYR